MFPKNSDIFRGIFVDAIDEDFIELIGFIGELEYVGFSEDETFHWGFCSYGSTAFFATHDGVFSKYHPI